MSARLSISPFILSVTCLILPTSADNWPQWRGPHGNGVSEETGIPVTWSRESNVLWRTPLPGLAGATPVVWEDRIFLTSADGENLVLICLNTGGEILWTRPLGDGNRELRGDEGNLASPSPCTDGEHVWALAGNGILGCFDFTGNEIWRVDLQERHGAFDIMFGLAVTPVLDRERLYLHVMHSGASFVVAMDKWTGADLWKVDRPSDAAEECEHTYASPVIYRDAEREYLITHGADYVVAHALEGGKEIWRCGGFNPKGPNYNPTLRFIASPTVVPGLIVVPSAKGGPVFGIRPECMGDITDVDSYKQWVLGRNTPDVPSPLVHDGWVYLCRENGVLICLDAKTGREVYQERTESDRHRASPVYADGHLYLTSRGGVVTVVQAGPDFKVLARNEMGEPISASPAISNGRIYLRSFDAVYAIGAR